MQDNNAYEISDQDDNEKKKIMVNYMYIKRCEQSVYAHEYNCNGLKKTSKKRGQKKTTSNRITTQNVGGKDNCWENHDKS